MEKSSNLLRNYVEFRVEAIRKERDYHEKAIAGGTDNRSVFRPGEQSNEEAFILMIAYHRNKLDQCNALLTELEYIVAIADRTS